MDAKTQAANRHRNSVKALNNLLGICSGLVCDGKLNDDEISYLRTWLLDNTELAGVWPGSIIATRVTDVLRDGIVTEEERA